VSDGIHPPKLETFDTTAMTNTDPKGIVRTVEEYRVEPFGLYMARPAPGRTQFDYLESWLLPHLGLRVTDFHFTPGHHRDQDFYLDVVDVNVAGPRWRTVDLYLDLALATRSRLDLIDVAELLAALGAGLLDAATAERAVRTAQQAVEGIAAAGYELDGWLRPKGIGLTWRRH
jgi:predicted RNA-binding protein associated with RNAse of E/G family